MTQERRRASAKAGLPPGTPVHVGHASDEPVRLQVVDYTMEHVQEREVGSQFAVHPVRNATVALAGGAGLEHEFVAVPSTTLRDEILPPNKTFTEHLPALRSLAGNDFS